MSEKLTSYESGQDKARELEDQSVEHREQMRENIERRAEQSVEQDAEKAKHEALEKAATVEKALEQEQPAKQERHADKPLNNKKNREVSFKKQMNEVRRDMSAPSRAFSKLIHNKPIEKVSEAVGSTVARPNAVLSGSLIAFVAVITVYLWARHVGYQLSGFETIGAFIVGWLVGIIFDFVRIMVTGKR